MDLHGLNISKTEAHDQGSKKKLHCIQLRIKTGSMEWIETKSKQSLNTTDKSQKGIYFYAMS